MRQPALPRFERPHHTAFHFSSRGQSRNRRRHTRAWRTFFLLLGLTLGWIAHGLLHP